MPAREVHSWSTGGLRRCAEHGLGLKINSNSVVGSIGNLTYGPVRIAAPTSACRRG